MPIMRKVEIWISFVKDIWLSGEISLLWNESCVQENRNKKVKNYKAFAMFLALLSIQHIVDSFNIAQWLNYSGNTLISILYITEQSCLSDLSKPW